MHLTKHAQDVHEETTKTGERNGRTITQMERWSMFLNRNIAYCQDVSSSQLDLLIQCNRNQILARSFCGYLPTYSDSNEEKQKTQNSQFITEEKGDLTLPNFNQDSMDW